MARRERRAYPLARPPADSHESPPPPRRSVRSEQRRQTAQSALARRVAPLFGLAGVARRLQTTAGMRPPRVLARSKIGATRGTWVFQQAPRLTEKRFVQTAVHRQDLPGRLAQTIADQEKIRF